MSFVTELRRRQVFRTAAWYGGVAWLGIEVANTVFPQFGLPAWTVRAVIVAALLGLPVALVLAWTFDLTSAGVRREEAARDAVPAAPVAPVAFWRMPSLWIALALGAGLALSAQQAWQRVVRPALAQRPSLAVLPFANLSPDPDNAYFADGLHEEILATLARAGGVRVLSRTSVQQYRDSRLSLREIADTLDADLVLEGSVRRDGDDLRLTLQLVDARRDEPIWTDTFDRKFRNVLTLQRTVAQQVVSAIGATLSPAEERLIAEAAPTVPEAYEPYLRALALWDQTATDAQLRTVLSLLDQSLAADPSFALAYALRAKVRIWLPTNSDVPSDALFTGAKDDIRRALELDPSLPEALAARGLYSTYVDLDPDRALPDFERALAMAPNDPDLHNAVGLALRRLGRYDEAIRHFGESARLSPGEVGFAYRKLETLLATGRLKEAELEQQAMERRFPAIPHLYLVRFYIRYLQTGRTDGWKVEFDRLAPTISDPGPLFWHAQRLMYATDATTDLADFLEGNPGPGGEAAHLDLACLYTELSRPDDARRHIAALLKNAEAYPDDAIAQVEAAVGLELSGRSAEAVAAADRAWRLAPPESRDAWNHLSVANYRAWVLVHSGLRADEGYAELERLLGKIDMMPRKVESWAPWRLLRGDPRAQALLRSRFPSA